LHDMEGLRLARVVTMCFVEDEAKIAMKLCLKGGVSPGSVFETPILPRCFKSLLVELTVVHTQNLLKVSVSPVEIIICVVRPIIQQIEEHTGRT